MASIDLQQKQSHWLVLQLNFIAILSSTNMKVPPLLATSLTLTIFLKLNQKCQNSNQALWADVKQQAIQMNNSDYTRQVSTMCQEFSDTRRILCAIAHFVERNVHVLKNLTALTFTQHGYRQREKTSTTKNRAPPVWDRRTHRGPLSLPRERLKLRGQQHRPWLKKVGGPSSAQPTPWPWLRLPECGSYVRCVREEQWRCYRLAATVSFDACLQDPGTATNQKLKILPPEWCNVCIFGLIPYKRVFKPFY